MNQLAAVEVRRLGGRTALFAANQQLSIRQRNSAIVILRDQVGNVGIGEAAPLPGYSRDTLAQAEAELRSLSISSLPTLSDAEPVVPQLLSAIQSCQSLRSPAARFAVEVALVDLLGRSSGRSMHQLLSADASAKDAIPINALIASDDCRSAVTNAKRYRNQGATCFKLKLGGDSLLSRDLEIATAVRQTVGGDCALRFDANGTYSPAMAARALASLATFRPEYVEEPVATTQLPQLGEVACPVALDESLAFHPMPEMLLDLPSVGAVVLKPTILGGLARTWELARAAKERRLFVSVSHCFEGPCAMAACAELAIAIAATSACGLAHHPALACFPRTQSPLFSRFELVPSRAHRGHGIILGDLAVES